MASPWLDERETRAWRGFLRMRTLLVARLARRLAETSNLTSADFEILVAVSEAPDYRIRARDLCAKVQWERSRLSHQINRMEERGTIMRAPCATDARGFDVVLTASGLRTIEAAAPLNLETVRHCFIDLLTAEQLQVLGDIAEVITDHLESAHDDAKDHDRGSAADS